MGESISIFVVDDLRLLREGLVSLLAEQEDITVIGTAASGSKALAKIKELRPEIALIDIGMPDKDGLTVTQALRQELPAVRDGKVFATDSSAYFARPGPRIVESLEILAHIIHPEMFPPPALVDAFRQVERTQALMASP